MSEPLQVISVDPETNRIVILKDPLEKVAANVLSSGAEQIAIVSVMGAYRTGKSFLLDLFLRYLRYAQCHADREHAESHANEAESAETRESFTPNSCITSLPDWLISEGEFLSEGAGESTKGFRWRGGMEKCTQGIWLWSHPFIVERSRVDQDGIKEDYKVAVLLLDSQGAFDSQMTKEQSATIFGLTAVLSSLQVYNISMQLQEDKIESLHYFMECAGSCMRFLTNGQSKSDPKLFQQLEFLVRDWPNFDSEWSVSRCQEQMADHLAQHVDRARESETPNAIKSMFETISCWMLPHPGIKINKVNWDGRLSDLDPEFVRFLDLYVRRTFGPDLRSRTILGQPLTPKTFVTVIESFVGAFADLVPKSATLASAIAKSANLLSKDQAINEYKLQLQKLISGDGQNGVDTDVFVRSENKARSQAIEQFTKGTTFGPEEDREIIKKELLRELDGLRVHFESENMRKVESALTVFAGVALLIGVLYLIDKVSDFTCDWYSDTCVRVSNALFLIYFTLIVAILTNAYFLYQSKGQAVTLIALIEMGKAAISLMAEYINSFRRIISDWKESRSDDFQSDLRGLVTRIRRDLENGVMAVGASLIGALKSKAQDN